MSDENAQPLGSLEIIEGWGKKLNHKTDYIGVSITNR